MDKEKIKSEFSINQHKGFTLKFENGYFLSVQFGPGNYCQNYNKDFDSPKKTNSWKSKNAEIAIWKKEESGFRTNEFGYTEDVAGYLSSDDVAKLIVKVQKAKA